MKLEIHYMKTGNFTNMGRLNNMLLSNQWVKGEIKNCLEINENGIVLYQNLWDEAKAVIRWKFMTNDYLKKQVSNNLTSHLKELAEEQMKLKIRRGNNKA